MFYLFIIIILFIFIYLFIYLFIFISVTRSTRTSFAIDVLGSPAILIRITVPPVENIEDIFYLFI